MSISIQQREILKGELKENQDYGYVNGISKPLLFKGGAEKLCIILGLDIKFSIVQYLPEFVLLECKLFDSEGKEVINGFGSAESTEPKFKGKGNNQLVKMAEKRAFVGAVFYI
jgi:hypothetical protein